MNAPYRIVRELLYRGLDAKGQPTGPWLSVLKAPRETFADTLSYCGVSFRLIESRLTRRKEDRRRAPARRA